MKDKINPDHYKKHVSGLECIDVARWFDFSLGNVIKYLWRAGEKTGESKLDDLRKAQRYLEFAIETEEILERRRTENDDTQRD